MPTLAKVVAVKHGKKRVAVDKPTGFVNGPAKLFNDAGIHIGTQNITEVSVRDEASSWLAFDQLPEKVHEGFQVLQ